jgi:hypothetical protein
MSFSVSNTQFPNQLPTVHQERSKLGSGYIRSPFRIQPTSRIASTYVNGNMLHSALWHLSIFCIQIIFDLQLFIFTAPGKKTPVLCKQFDESPPKCSITSYQFVAVFMKEDIWKVFIRSHFFPQKMPLFWKLLHQVIDMQVTDKQSFLIYCNFKSLNYILALSMCIHFGDKRLSKS